MPSLLKKFMRRKVVDKDETSTELNRILSTIDLTLLGIGSTLGIGVYVLAGSVAKDSAGPAVVVSFFVAAFASVLAGLCYAEFGARVPKAGSAYVYSYVCVGELIAFIVGWNLIMEYVIGVASVAKGYSGYVDQLFDNALSTAFNNYVPIKVPLLSDYFDAFAFAITLVLTFLLAFGVKESSFFNNIFTFLNLGVVLFVVIAGSFYATPKNWFLNKYEILNSTNITAEKVGEGGFAPFGFNGIMKGAATCFYGFVGFDCIATTGEEAKNPQRAIPLAIIFSLLFIFLAYFGISTIITMMVPYYLQDGVAPLPQAFLNVDFNIGRWIVTIGALFGLSTSLLGAMFPMPRVIYAMSSDGVLFKFLAKVHPRFQTPLIATLFAGTFGGLMAALFKLEALIDMMSIGTLTAYTLVAVCVLCLRYRKDVDGADDIDIGESSSMFFQNSIWNYPKQFLNSPGLRVPTEFSSSYTNWAVIFYCIFTVLFCGVAIFGEDEIIQGDTLILSLLGICGLFICLILISLSLQPVSRVELSFKVPLVPIVPGFSILANTYLIMKLSAMTWLRFGVWMLIGFIIYGICLCNGTTDRSYESALEERRKRRYSKISASGFVNKGLVKSEDQLINSSDQEGCVTQRVKGNKATNNLSMNTFMKNGDVDTKECLLNTCADEKEVETINPKCLTETETPKPLTVPQNKFELLEEPEFTPKESRKSSDDIHAEEAAVEAIDIVISQACSQIEAKQNKIAPKSLPNTDEDTISTPVKELSNMSSLSSSSQRNSTEEATMTFSDGSSSSEESLSLDGPIMDVYNGPRLSNGSSEVEHRDKQELILHNEMEPLAQGIMKDEGRLLTDDSAKDLIIPGSSLAQGISDSSPNNNRGEKETESNHQNTPIITLKKDYDGPQ